MDCRGPEAASFEIESEVPSSSARLYSRRGVPGHAGEHGKPGFDIPESGYRGLTQKECVRRHFAKFGPAAGQL
jgi:hypothetical protein